jgi:hypothetical protein
MRVCIAQRAIHFAVFLEMNKSAPFVQAIPDRKIASAGPLRVRAAVGTAEFLARREILDAFCPRGNKPSSAAGKSQAAPLWQSARFPFMDITIKAMALPLSDSSFETCCSNKGYRSAAWQVTHPWFPWQVFPSGNTENHPIQLRCIALEST